MNRQTIYLLPPILRNKISDHIKTLINPRFRVIEYTKDEVDCQPFDSPIMLKIHIYEKKGERMALPDSQFLF